MRVVVGGRGGLGGGWPLVGGNGTNRITKVLQGGLKKKTTRRRAKLKVRKRETCSL